MRLFLAMLLSSEAQASLAGVGRVLRASFPVVGGRGKVSWVGAGNLHLTVKFLGEVVAERVPGICDALMGLGVGARLPISVRAEHLECFPPRGAVRVITAGIGGDAGPLVLLHDRVEEVCAGLGFGREGRRYRPHVTLGRARTALAGSVREKLTMVSALGFLGRG